MVLDSEISDASDLDGPLEESLADRIAALKDIIPPTTRRRLGDTYASISSYGKSGFWLAAKSAYAISVSALFISVPFVYLMVEDMQLGEQEKEIKMREMGNEILTPGAGGAAAEDGKVRASL